VLFLGNGQSAPIMPAGAPGNLIVKNVAFEAPRRPNGRFADFRTDLAVYRDGVEVARKTIRVNDPLEAGGYVFHQNTFGPAVDLRVLDPASRPVWVGPVVLDGFYQGRPQGFREVPGADFGLFLVLTKDESGAALLAVEGLSRPQADGSVVSRFAATIGPGEQVPAVVTAGYRIEFVGTSSWTGLVVKRDPGQPIIWVSFALLLAGLVLTFYLPRVRIWARFTGTTLELAVLGDRFVDPRRELERVIAALPSR
jgi:cytochrome c biogenesis protein